MELKNDKPVIDASGEMVEQSFSVEDQGMLFDILRNKMYNDPIRAICREITCNARDAHREVGKGDVPIQISLPTALDSRLIIKDFGPGISPSRMSNVFIKYTASTKRNSNLQTGGFGLGAKTPFSYSDTFNIVTVHDGIKYNYTCYIDETKVGKIALLSQEDTFEQNGTEIIIPVDKKDWSTFDFAIKEYVAYFEVTPIINGRDDWKSLPVVMFQGSNWKMSRQYTYDILILVDNVPYMTSRSVLSKYINTDWLPQNHLFEINFAVGELSLAANRESISFDEPTIKVIKKAFANAAVEKNKIFQDEISNATSLKQAVKAYTEYCEIFHSHNGHKVSWNGIDIYSLIHDRMRHRFTSYCINAINKKLKVIYHSEALWKDVSQVIVSDIDAGGYSTSDKKAIKNYLLDNNKKYAHIVSFNQTILDNLANDVDPDKLYLKHLDYIFLSTLIKPKKRSGGVYHRFNVFKHNPNGRNEFIICAHKDFLNDKRKKVLVKLTDNDKWAMFNDINDHGRKFQTILAASKFDDEPIAFYGYLQSESSKKIDMLYSNTVSLETYAEKLLNYTKINWELFEYNDYMNQLDSSYNAYTQRESIQSIIPLINAKNSPYRIESKNYLSYQETKIQRNFLDLRDVFDKRSSTEKVEAWAKENNKSLAPLDKALSNIYPFLEYFKPATPSHIIANYINSVDAQKGIK